MPVNFDVSKLSQSAARKTTPHDNCTVLDLGTGNFPRDIEVRLPDDDGARQIAVWDGSLNLAINDEVFCNEYGGNPKWRIASMGGADSGAGKVRVSELWRSGFDAVAMQSDVDGKIGIPSASPATELDVTGVVTAGKDFSILSSNTVGALSAVTDAEQSTVTANYLAAIHGVPSLSGSQNNTALVGIRAFFVQPTYDGSATLTGMAGFDVQPVINSGVATNTYGLYSRDPNTTGGGTATNAFGVYVANLISATNKWAFYADGTTQSYFGGKVGFAKTVPLTKIHLDLGQLLIDTNAFSTAKFNSQGVAWSSLTTLASQIFNSSSSSRPEISWYRGGRTYPEFAIRQHTTGDSGGEVYSGTGLGVPTLTMTFKGGDVGVRVSAPQGVLHGYDTISGFIFWEYDGLDATVRTIIPNGAGDCLYRLHASYVLRDSAAAVASGTTDVSNGASVNLTVGGNTVRLRVNADGSIDVARTAGTDTIKVALTLRWL